MPIDISRQLCPGGQVVDNKFILISIQPMTGQSEARDPFYKRFGQIFHSNFGQISTQKQKIKIYLTFKDRNPEF
jgi:hypothetical protein